MKPLYTKNRTIGLLGGSFNPAHAGHLHISLHALRALRMDRVWWLVSPQNPLKEKEGMAAYEKRLASARKAARHRDILVSDIEARLGVRYTYQTLVALKRRYPGTQFVWMMGADNLAVFHRWQRWRDILSLVPVVVFDRAPYSYTSLASKTYLRMRRFLGARHAPGMRFVHLKRDATSATALRKMLGKKAFLRDN